MYLNKQRNDKYIKKKSKESFKKKSMTSFSQYQPKLTETQNWGLVLVQDRPISFGQNR